jgi:predicted branched-subunit amino acid permease
MIAVADSPFFNSVTTGSPLDATPPQTAENAPLRFTLAGVLEGARLSAAVLPGTMVMAAAIGTLCAQKGLDLSHTVLMNGLVFAGASQLVALQVWAPPFTAATLLALALVTATVNIRYILMTASLRPWMGGMPPLQVYPLLLFTVDASWLVAMRYRSGGGSDPGVLLGATLAIWSFWMIGTVPGHLAGALVGDPHRFGFDLALPAFFAAMLVPLWRGPRRAIAWAIAAAVSLAVSFLLPGWWFIVVGTLAGSVAGGFIDDRR